ncbi:MAG: hypothetical protein IKD69_02500 [Solobacterium sp.]|nr:hypothetical protein [Solobacterium sp.]
MKPGVKIKHILIVILLAGGGIGIWQGYEWAHHDYLVKAQIREQKEIQKAKDLAYKRLARSLSVVFNDEVQVVEYGSEFDERVLVLEHSGTLEQNTHVDTMRTGKQTVSYTVTGTEDQYGQTAEKTFEKTVVVKDTQMPWIDFKEDTITIQEGTTITRGANVLGAHDAVDGDLEYTVDGDVDSSTPGDYIMRVTAHDHNGNTAVREYLVTVKEKPKPKIPPASAGPAPDYIYSFLTGTMGLNRAAACGVMGNLYAESSFDPGCDDSGYYGLVQWGGGRRSNLMSWCEANGYAYWTTEGQCAFMYHELQTSYSGCLNNLYGVEDSADGAAAAAIIFVHQYEGAASEGNRANLAVGYYGG